MTIIGYERSTFIAKGSTTEITGYTVYLSRPIVSKDGQGVAVDRIYITDAKLAACGFKLDGSVGKEVEVLYSRYGKVMSLAAKS